MQAKSAQFQDFKREKFEEISGDPERMFLFFAANNDTFGFISPEDQETLNRNYMDYANRSFNWFFGAMAGVFFIDKVLLKYKYPNFRINSMRPLVFLFKWLLIPCISYSIGRSFFMDDIDNTQIEIMDRYNFGFEDFTRAMRIWDRAERVGRLEQLFEKRGDFDWSTVPELPAIKTKAWDA